MHIRLCIDIAMNQNKVEEESEDFELDDIDEFEDYGEGEDSKAASVSQKSFKEAQKERMTWIAGRNVKHYENQLKGGDNAHSNNKRYSNLCPKHVLWLYRRTQAIQEQHKKTLGNQNGGNSEAVYNAVFDNLNQYTNSSYDNSPSQQYGDTDEFEGEDVKHEYIRRTTKDSIEDVEVIVRKVGDETEELTEDMLYG